MGDRCNSIPPALTLPSQPTRGSLWSCVWRNEALPNSLSQDQIWDYRRDWIFGTLPLDIIVQVSKQNSFLVFKMVIFIILITSFRLFDHNMSQLSFYHQYVALSPGWCWAHSGCWPGSESCSSMAGGDLARCALPYPRAHSQSPWSRAFFFFF